MTYIPNTRLKTIHNPVTGEDRDNAYYEGNLNTEHKRELSAYDFAIDDMITFFSNLDTYFDPYFLDTNLIASDERDITDINKSSIETKLMIRLKEALEEWMESSRNEFVVSMRDNEDD